MSSTSPEKYDGEEKEITQGVEEEDEEEVCFKGEYESVGTIRSIPRWDKKKKASRNEGDS